MKDALRVSGKLYRHSLVGIAVVILGGSLGCGGATTPGSNVPAAEGTKYLMPSEPDGARSVVETRKSAKDGEEIVVVGRIGGDTKPWVDGRASFQIVDTSLVPCNEREGDSCPTPWDYCCDTDVLPQSMASVKFVNDDGKTVPVDARKLLGLEELLTVVVKGKAKRDEAGNLTVLAESLYVRPVSH